MRSIFSAKSLLVMGLAAFVGMVGWYTLRGSSSPDALLVTENVGTGAPNETERDLVATLLQLRAIGLDGTIFSDPAFQSLVDYGIEIVPEPVGRENPFAPLPGTQIAPNAPGSPAPTR
jgi:hypothetical protein